MQGESDRQRELLDVGSVAGHLLEPGSVFALLAEHRDRLFPAVFRGSVSLGAVGGPPCPAWVMVNRADPANKADPRGDRLNGTGAAKPASLTRAGSGEPPVGIEPTTYSLRVNRSAD